MAAATAAALPAMAWMPHAAASNPPIELPYRITRGGLMLVRARINAAVDADFIFDTGAPVTVLLDVPELAALGLDTSQARRLGPADNPAVPIGVFVPGAFVELGGLTVRPRMTIALPTATLACSERLLSLGAQGILGADLLRERVVEVDPQRQLLRLHEHSQWQPATDAAVLPLQFVHGLPLAEIGGELRGQPLRLRMLVDTGKSRPLSLIAGSDPALTWPAEGKSETACFVSGQRELREGAALDLHFGAGLVARGVTPLMESHESLHVSGRHGMLGAAMLARFRQSYDFPGKRLVLQAL